MIIIPCQASSLINRKTWEKLDSTITELFIGNTEYNINGKKLRADYYPFIYKNRTLVSSQIIILAFLAENSVYDYPTHSITFEFKDNMITLYHDNPIALVNRKKIDLDVSAFVLQGRFQIPLRFIAETLGASVEWEPNAQKVTIIYDPK
jgi:hypothetical protein